MPLITTLIDKRDTSEIVRDQIAAILLDESIGQQLLAVTEGEDPTEWALRVFLERDNPWEDFVNAPGADGSTEPAMPSPIVAVSLDNTSYDKSASDVVERQKTTGVYYIDCYGYSVTTDDGPLGHLPGDQAAALEAQRAARLVRNTLMAAQYTYLGMRGVVWGRWIQGIQLLKPQIDGRAMQNIHAARITFEVTFNEFSPQVQAPNLEIISATIKRAETGQIYFTAQFGGT